MRLLKPQVISSSYKHPFLLREGETHGLYFLSIYIMYYIPTYMMPNVCNVVLVCDIFIIYHYNRKIRNF